MNGTAMLGQFLRNSGDHARKFAYKLAGNAEEAEELVQEASYKTLAAWRQFRQVERLDGWFFTILRNAHRDSERRYERRNAVSIDCPTETGLSFADFFVSNENLHEQLERDELIVQIREVISQVSADERKVLMLHADGFAYDQIARALRIPIGTVRSRLWRARKSFRKLASGLVG